MQVDDKLYSIDTALYEAVLTRSHLVVGDYLVLIDSGIKSTYGQVVETLKGLGFNVAAIKLLLISHGHADHVGSNYQIAQASGCLVGAHQLAVPWVENYQLQFDAVFDPFPEILPASQEVRDWVFGSMDRGSRVDLRFDEGLVIDLGQGVTLEVFHLPGHTPGDVGYYQRDSRTMIIGDATPFLEDLSLALYYDLKVMRNTLGRLQSLRHELPFDTLLSSHYPPMRGAEIDHHLQECLGYMLAIEEIVVKQVCASGHGATHAEIAQAAAQTFGKGYDFVALTTSYAHLKDLEARGGIVQKNGRWIPA